MESYDYATKNVDLYGEKELKIRIATITTPKQIKISETVIEYPGDRQVRIKLQGCGICGSNIPVWQGRKWFQYPYESGSPGHEGWGIIEHTGTCVKKFNVGDRVTFLSNNAFSEYENVDETNIVKLPSNLDNIPFPGEAFGCAMNIFNRCSINSGDVIAIVGIGCIGTILTALAAYKGAYVIAISRRNFALSMAKEMGASELLNIDDPDIIEKVYLSTKSKFCDIVIEATGLQSCLDIASRLTRIRGKLVIAGYHQDGLRTVNMQEWNWKGIDVINAHEREEHIYIDGIKMAVDAVSKGIFNPLTLCTHKFNFELINDAFEAAETRPDGFLKAIVVM